MLPGDGVHRRRLRIRGWTSSPPAALARAGWAIAAAANTAGNIVGVLFFGFVALPALGGLGAGG